MSIKQIVFRQLTRFNIQGTYLEESIMNKTIKLILGIQVLGVLLIIPTINLHATTTLGSLTLTTVKCRIFTPNGDGKMTKRAWNLITRTASVVRHCL